MGKHAAAEGASDPIVAAALAAKHGDSHGAHSVDRAEGEHPVGWPAPSVPDGGGLGWPADADRGSAAHTVAEPDLRRGWRRLFGARRVA